MFDIKEYWLSNDEKDSIYIVYSTCYINPTEYLREIENKLKEMEVKNKHIYFDLLLCVGNSRNRYSRVWFNGEKFVKSQFRKIDFRKGHIIRYLSSNFYSHMYYKNRVVIESSVLTMNDKHLISKGVCI